jgi:hypothetical protein
MFDTFYFFEIDKLLSQHELNDTPLNVVADYEFLRERQVVLDPAEFLPNYDPPSAADIAYIQEMTTLTTSLLTLNGPAEMIPMLNTLNDLVSDLWPRLLSSTISRKTTFQTAPICKAQLPPSLKYNPTIINPLHNVLTVSLQAFPVPDETCAWQDILDFKAEMRDKPWSYRRWLNDLAAKQRTDAEIRDDIEWSVNEYEKAMTLLKLKASASFMELYLVPTVEAFETLKPSAFLKGLVSVKKREIAMLEAEANAPGGECAYVYDARKRFAG